ncbi:MAG: FAD-dependent monooxygenase [Pseudomonadales bacterium]|nr:FAD-dependent monooxygenase [Pseudomonadales bacterium]
MTNKSNVLIVGAGPVGMAMAATLALQGIKADIIDQSSQPTDLSKAIGIHSITIELMNTLGLAEAFIENAKSHQIAKLNADNKEVLKLNFSTLNSHYDQVLALPQSRTESMLRQRLKELGVCIQYNCKLENIVKRSPEDYLVTLCCDGKKDQRHYNWILACDGGYSKVRELMHIPFPGGEYDKSFVLGDVKIQWQDPSKDELQFFLSKRGYLLIVPLPDGMHRLICQVSNEFILDKDTGEKRQISLDELQDIVDDRGPKGLKVLEAEWLTSAPFYHRMAESAIHDNVILAGDALHLYSPLGGQGLNTGFQDVFNLSWKLAWHIKGWANRDVLQSYDTERLEVAKRVQDVTAKTTAFITGTSPWLCFVRRYLLPWYGKKSSVQNGLPLLYSGLKQSYLVSPLNGINAETGEGLQAGSRMMNISVNTAQEKHQALATQLHGTEFTLIFIGKKNANKTFKAYKAVVSFAEENYPLRVRLLSSEAPKKSQLQAPQESIDSLLPGVDSLWCLVRPDGHIAMTAKASEIQSIQNYLEHHFMFENMPLQRAVS